MQPLQPSPGAPNSLIGWISTQQKAAALAGGFFNIER
jgi:hypothetical protein